MRSLALVFLACLLAIPSFAQPTKRPTSTAKPKPAATPVKKPNENAEWEKATAVVGDAERVAALKKFVAAFPKTTRLSEAAVLIVTAEASLGHERLAAGDVDGAASFFKKAANDVLAPVSDHLFNDTLIKFPVSLYFRGARLEAIAIARIIASRSAENATQLLALASFYLSTENGSEAKRLAEAAIKIDPNSSAAYQALGLADRVDFLLDEAASAFAKAVELEPDSLTAKRGLAEMKRALGKADEAAVLYREILEKDAANVPAQTGLILSLFDGAKRTEAEAEMAKSLEAVPGNVILLAGAAYWYAAHDVPDKAVEYARRAVETDPRFIWSHIALARGLLGQKKPTDAERTLLAARRYGNFPTLEYELASARVAAGYYREAAEELAKSFSVKDGVVRTVLGGRISRESKDFTELVGFERRASIYAPTAADNPENAARLTALLEFKQQLDATEAKPDAIAKAADDFIKGDDRMKVHRQIFAASKMLERQVALPKVVEITKAAVQNVSAGLEDPNASVAVTAAELYEPRAIAGSRGEYVDVPTIPRMTLSAVIRGQIEEISGWALFHLDDANEAVVRLRRAVAVLPQNSAWWRSSTWRLATALAATGSDNEALEMFIKSYKSAGPNAFRYSTIETLYTKVKGSADGLEAQIGPNPAGRVAQVMPSPVSVVEATPQPSSTPVMSEAIAATTPTPVEFPAVVPVARPEPSPLAVVPTPDPSPIPEPSPTVESSPEPLVVPVATVTPTPEAIPSIVPTESPTPTPEVSPTPEPLPMVQITASPEATPAEVKTINPIAELFPPVVITIPQPGATKVPTATPAPPPEAEPEASPVGSPTPTTEPSPDPSPIATPEQPVPEPSPSPVLLEPSPTPSPLPSATPEKRPDETTVADVRPRFADTRTPVAPPRIKPCKITFSEETITLQTGGGDQAVIVRREDEAELGEVSAVSSSPRDVSVRKQPVPGNEDPGPVCGAADQRSRRVFFRSPLRWPVQSAI